VAQDFSGVEGRSGKCAGDLCTGKEFFGGSFFSDFVSGKSQRAYFTDAQNHGWLYGGHEICHSGCGKNGNGI